MGLFLLPYAVEGLPVLQPSISNQFRVMGLTEVMSRGIKGRGTALCPLTYPTWPGQPSLASWEGLGLGELEGGGRVPHRLMRLSKVTRAGGIRGPDFRMGA